MMSRVVSVLALLALLAALFAGSVNGQSQWYGLLSSMVHLPILRFCMMLSIESHPNLLIGAAKTTCPPNPSSHLEANSSSHQRPTLHS